MNKLTFLLARRYLLGSTYERSISTVTLICFISIFVASGSLTLVNAVMRGFQVAVHQKLQGIHADATIQSYDAPLNEQAIQQVISDEFPEIVASSPVHIGNALIQSDEYAHPTVLILNGIDPHKERLVSNIETKLTPHGSLATIVHGNTVAIGRNIADAHNLCVGDTFTLYYLDELSGKRKVTVHQQEALVGGIFKTGIEEYDANLIYTSLSFFHKLFSHDGADQIKITFAPTIDHEISIKKLHQRLMLDVYSWKQLYPSLVSALQLERYAMFFILLLITIVASMNIIALLFMLIQAKKSDIAILHSMGASLRMIKSIFIAIALTITGLATTLGLLCAAGICWLLNTYPFITLPDTYYVSHLPAQLEWHMIVLVFATIMIIAILATIVPLRNIKRSAIAQVLRFEG